MWTSRSFEGIQSSSRMLIERIRSRHMCFLFLLFQRRERCSIYQHQRPKYRLIHRSLNVDKSQKGGGGGCRKLSNLSVATIPSYLEYQERLSILVSCLIVHLVLGSRSHLQLLWAALVVFECEAYLWQPKRSGKSHSQFESPPGAAACEDVTCSPYPAVWSRLSCSSRNTSLRYCWYSKWAYGYRYVLSAEGAERHPPVLCYGDPK